MSKDLSNFNISGKVYRTNDYSIFKDLEGNREVRSSRINKIVSSIKKVGYIQSPIIINEKYEVVDGQGRLAALKKLNMPVDFIVSPGAGINECISMNINMENWKLQDYIDCYAELGNENYIRLSVLMANYKTKLDIIATAAFGNLSMSSKLVNSGGLVLTDEDVEKASKKIEFANNIIDSLDLKYVKGSKTALAQCLILCYDYDGVDRKKFTNQVIKNFNQSVASWSNVEECMRVLEDIYNTNLHTNNRLFLRHLFELDRLKKKSDVRSNLYRKSLGEL